MAELSYTVRFRNVPPGERVWVYLCSQNNGKNAEQRTWTDDRHVTLSLPDIAEGGNDNGATKHTLVAFARGRQPVWAQINTANPQPELRFEDELGLGIGIWILAGDFERQRIRALNSVLVANAILFEENTGVRIEVDEIINAVDAAAGSGLVSGGGWTDVVSVAQEINNLGSKLVVKKQFRSHHINVFYTDSIGKGLNTHGHRLEGNGTFMTSIALNRYALDDLLLHELGHTLDLDDESSPDSKTVPIPTGRNSRRNVMQHASVLRRYFTEGQIARMHFSAASALVDVYNIPRPPSMNSWYANARGTGLLSLDLVLTEERNHDGHPLPPLNDETFLAMTGIPGVMVSAMPALRSVETVEAILASSRERYCLRTRQLQRELQRTSPQPKFDIQDALRLCQTSMEEYVAADLTRLWEYYRTLPT